MSDGQGLKHPCPFFTVCPEAGSNVEKGRRLARRVEKLGCPLNITLQWVFDPGGGVKTPREDYPRERIPTAPPFRPDPFFYPAAMMFDYTFANNTFYYVKENEETEG